MAGRHLKDLIVAYQRRDDLAFRRATQAIIEEEEAKKHTALARDLRRMLAASAGPGVDTEAVLLPDAPRDRDSGVPLLDLVPPGRVLLGDLVLDTHVQVSLLDMVEETQEWPVLDAAGVPRRQRLLMYGPPGCGKTSAAAGMATELGLPLAIARVDSLMSSFLGETAANLRALFDFAAQVPCVLLLDEFDTMGKLRSDPSDHGELRRVVNAVLQMVESYRGSSIIVAATNSPEILDAALWRRFDDVLELPLPRRDEIYQLLNRLLPQHPERPALRQAAAELVGLPHAAATATANGARRSAIRHHRTPTAGDLEEGLRRVVTRPWA